MVRSGIHRAETEEEKLAVYRLRYDVYVAEMGRYGAVADHENRLLVEPEDETARIVYAAEDGEVVATARLSWGGDAPFTKRLIEQYMLEPFLAELPAEAMAVSERAMVAPRLRGSQLVFELGKANRDVVFENRIQLLFGACEPHLLTLYTGRGARTYSDRNINSPESGYLIPIVTVVEDVDYLRRIGAPGVEEIPDHGDDARIPECVDRLITGRTSVVSQRMSSPDSYWNEIHKTLGEIAEKRISPFDGLSEEEATRCLGKSNIIACRQGDRLVKKGGVARNVFIVLDGNLEVRDDGKLLRVLCPGDVFGEIAFLLERPRTADVYAATEGVRILSLSETELRRMTETDPGVAARLLLNIAKILCARILQNA